MNTVWMIAQRAPATNATYRKFTKSRHTKRRGRGAHSSAQIVHPRIALFSTYKPSKGMKWLLNSIQNKMQIHLIQNEIFKCYEY